MDGELYTEDQVLKHFYDAFNCFMRDMEVINGKWEDAGAECFREMVIGGACNAASAYHSAIESMEWEMEKILNKASSLTGNDYRL